MDSHRSADRAELAVTRQLVACDLEAPLERAAVLQLLIQRLTDRRDRDLHLARLDDHATYAEIGRVLGISRQAARRRYGRDETKGDREG